MQDAPLFRAEAQQHRLGRLHGSVSLVTPLSWQLLGFLLLGALVSVFGFLSIASYERVELVNGAVVLDKGVATIMPSYGDSLLNP